MRHEFSKLLLKYAKKNKKIILCTFDMGYKMWDDFREELPDQFFNLGISEQAGMGAAVGMALTGKIPFVYSITPFLLWRPAETIRLYINHEKLPINLIGSGRSSDYMIDGFSHYGGDDKDLMSGFKYITPCWPKSNEEMDNVLKDMVKGKKPYYLNLMRQLCENCK